MVKGYKPTFKNYGWFIQAQLSGLLNGAIYSGVGEPDKEYQVYVAYALDMDDKIGCLTQDTYPELSLDQIHQQALSALRSHLAPIDWQLHTHSNGGRDYTLAYFEGDYYAAEVILLQERMQELHSRLGAKRLLVSMPVRGLLVAIPFDHDDKGFLQAFLAIVYEQFDQSPEAERLSDTIWAVVDGEIAGTLAINKEYREWSERQLAAVDTVEPAMDAIGSEKGNDELTALFTPTQLAIAGFIGTPFAGLLAISLNYFALKKTRNGFFSLLLSVIALVALLVLYIYVPRTDYDRLVPGVTALFIAIVGKVLFFSGNAYSSPVKRQTILKLVGVIVIGLLVSFGVLVIAGIVLDPQ